MSRINYSCGISNLANGLRASADGSYTSAEDIVHIRTATTVEESDALASRPKACRLMVVKCLENGPLVVTTGSDTQILEDGEGLLYRFDDRQLRAFFVVTCDTGVTGGTYIDLPTILGDTIRIWFDIDNGSTPPAAPAQGRLVEVDLTGGYTIIDMQDALVAAFEDDADFEISTDTDIVNLRSRWWGEIDPGDIGGDSGLTVTASYNGSVPTVTLSSTADALYMVALTPN